MSAMCRNGCGRHQRHARKRGFALPTAIFLMVILAALGVFLVRISLLQTGSSSLDTLGSGAYQAARAGVEWGAYNSLRNTTCAASTSLTFAGTALSPFTATVTCSSTTANELGTTVTIDQISATACNEPPCPNASPTVASYTERKITVVVGR